LQILIQDDELAVDIVTALICGGKDDIVQGATAPSVLIAMIDMSLLKYKNFARQREQFVGNCEPRNEAQ
jgi:hypothetical protein